MPLSSSSRPGITGRVLTRLPATLRALGGLAVSKLNGIWTIYPDFSTLNSINAASLANPSSKQIWVYDPVSGEFNVLTLAALGDALYAATSTSSLAIGVGAKTFVTQEGKDFAVGSWGISYSAADPTKYMVWQVTSYNGTSLVVNVTAYGGSGTVADWVIRASSPPGAVGKSSGYSYSWLTSTASSDPGSGGIKANNATFASITAVYLSETDSDGNNNAAALAAIAAITSATKARLKVYDPVTPSNFMTFDVTAFTDNGTWQTLTVTPRDSGGSFSASLALRAEFSNAGDKGDVAATQFTFSTTTADADPGSGFLRLNNATAASATAAYVDNNDRNGNAISAWLDTFDDSGNSSLRGILQIFDALTPSINYLYSLSGSVVDGTGYRKLTLAYISGTGAFTNNNRVGVAFYPRGPAGVGDLTSTNNLSDLASPKTGYDNISVHGADIAAAATIDLDSATGNQVDITGNTTITAVTLSNGRKRWCRFTGTPVLTHGASLVLPGAASITMAAGDWVLFVGFSAGVVRVAQILRAAGRPLNGGVADTLAVGFLGTPGNIGTKSSGTYTPNPLTDTNCPYVTNGGAHTLAPPSTAFASMVIEYTNNASAGAVTTSSFTKVTGDTITTTDGHKFLFFVTKHQNYSHLHVQALQ